MQPQNAAANRPAQKIPGPHSALLGKVVGYLTLAATFALIFFFLVLPVGNIMIKAFHGSEGWTLQYFALLFENDLQTGAIANSLKIGVLTVIFSTLLTLPLGLINTRFDYRGKGLLSGLLLVPMVMPPFVAAIGFQRFFSKYGAINLWLLEAGWIETPINWLSETNMIWVVTLLEVLHLYPIMYLNLTAALANIDPTLEEMARLSGASRWNIYRRIVWPLARPGYFAGAIIVFIWALTDLGTPLLVGFHETMPVRIFNMVTDVNENPVGFALVFVVIVMTVAIFLVSKFLVGGKKYEMMAKGHVTSAVEKATLPQTVGFYLLAGAVIIAALLPHISVFITSISKDWFMTALPEAYTGEYYQMAFSTELSMNGIKNSLLFSALSTLVDLVLGILIAYVIVRRLVPFPGLLDALVMVPLALPGIVLAFGYVVTYSHTFLDPLENPVPLLVIAYAIRRLPYMVRSATAGLMQMSRSLEEASETFGASRFHTIRKITIPLVAANLIAGALLCFAYAMLDVSDSLILAMKDRFYPMTKAIYVLFLEQGSGEFVASALGMVAMAILTTCIVGASMILGKKMGELFRS